MMLRELTQYENEMVAGGTGGGGLSGFLNGVGEGIGGAVGEAFITWLLAPSEREILASRFQPEAGQEIDDTGPFTRVNQADGEVWIDWDNDGVMDALMWEDPADGDDRIDWVWDEYNDVWKKAWIGFEGFPTPTNVSEN